MFEAHVCVFLPFFLFFLFSFSFVSFEPSSSSNLTPVNFSLLPGNTITPGLMQICATSHLFTSRSWLSHWIIYQLLRSVQCCAWIFLSSVLTVWCSPMWKENNLKDPVTSKLLILHFIHQSSPENSSSGRLIGSMHSLCVLTSHWVVMLAEQTYGWWGDYESRIRLFMND